MKKQIFPFYPLLLAAFPAIVVMANNRHQTQLRMLLRPLLLSIALGTLLFGIAILLLKRNINKAAMISGVTILLFFSYGHVFNLVESIGFLDLLFGRHRILMGLFLFLLIGTIIFSLKYSIKPDATKLMNYFSIILITLPIIQLSSFYISETFVKRKANNQNFENLPLSMSNKAHPDIYYIILDGYTRPDALLGDYNVDVMDFINEMQALGFYYANESQCNYCETFSSLTTALNMQYIPSLVNELDTTHGSFIYQESLKSNKVRRLLESAGYQTIAFSTGYRWSELDDADIYHYVDFSNPIRGLSSFEALYIKTLAIYPLRGYFFNSNILEFPYDSHVEAQINILEVLPTIPDNPEPSFTFAHLLIPHVPYVFDKDGSILTDPGYYGGDDNDAINDQYRLDGYSHQILFISQQILSISENIINQSETAPIIIIQSDHGFRGDNRSKILNLYYFPDQNYEKLYPSITPVNSFRIILSQYFNENFDILEDKTFE